MSTKAADELLSDPIALAIAVLVDRIRSLPKEDRNDLFELTEAITNAQTDEDYDAAARAMREILKQKNGGVQQVQPEQTTPELQKWMHFIGGRIKHCRELAELTQDQLAEKSGLPQSHISRLERGHHSPSSMTLEKIAAALGITAKELDPST